MPVSFGLGGVHVKLRGADSASFDLLKTQGSARSKGIQRGDKALAVRPGSGQGPHQHVSTNTGKSVQIADPARH
jgi:hypothetical protein